MKYRHITTGVVVSSDQKLPGAVYEPISEAKPDKKPAKQGDSKAKE